MFGFALRNFSIWVANAVASLNRAPAFAGGSHPRRPWPAHPIDCVWIDGRDDGRLPVSVLAVNRSELAWDQWHLHPLELPTGFGRECDPRSVPIDLHRQPILVPFFVSERRDVLENESSLTCTRTCRHRAEKPRKSELHKGVCADAENDPITSFTNNTEHRRKRVERKTD